MAEFILPDAQYIISLDNLDMVYMSRYIEKPFHAKRLLRTKSDIEGESTYCQVKIVSKNETPAAQACIICNVFVPKEFIKQHNNSKKHINMEKLTKMIIENNSIQTDITIYDDDDDDDDSKDEESDTFYCDVCAEPVYIGLKLTHNKTSKHLKSKKDVKLTADFLKMYVDSRQDVLHNRNDDETLENRLSDDDSDTDSDSNDYESDSDFEFDSDPEYYNIDNIAKIKKSKKTKMDMPVKISNNAKRCTPEEIKDFEMYLQEVLIKHYVYNDLNFNLMVFEDCIEVVTAKGRRNKITVDVFHSYKHVDKMVFCQVCQLWTDEDTKVHSVTDQHIKLITQPIDENFARRINFEWSHCLVCNERIYPDSDHAEYNSYHKSQLNTSNQFGVQIENDDVDIQSFCYICRVNIRKSATLLHINSKEHKNKWKSNYGNTSKCMSCKENSKFEINSSNNGRPILKLERALPPISNDETDDSKLEFLNSKLRIFNRNKAAFAKSSTADSSFYSYCKQFSYIDNTLVLCNVCDKNIPNDRNDIIFHVENKSHCDAVANLLKVNRIIIAYDTPLYYCKYCDELSSSFVEHIGEAEHVDLVKINEIVDINKLWQVTCDTGRDGAKDVSYKEMFNDLLKKNHVQLKGDMYYCDKCQFALNKIDVPTHLICKRHTDSMKNK